MALGHPIGASGARILTTLIYALKDRGLKRGIATLCLGGGNGVALAIETYAELQPLVSSEHRIGPRIRISLITAHTLCVNEVVEPVAPRDRFEEKRVREVELRRERPQRHHAERRRGVGPQPVEQHV